MKLTVVLTAAVTYDVDPGSFEFVADPSNVSWDEGDRIASQEARRFARQPDKLFRMTDVGIHATGKVEEWDPELPPDEDALRACVAVALDWLANVEQPDDAGCAYTAASVRIPGTNRELLIEGEPLSPDPLLTLGVANPGYVGDSGAIFAGFQRPTRQLGAGEADRFAALLTEMGQQVHMDANSDSARAALRGFAIHPTLRAARDRYDNARNAADTIALTDRLVPPAWPATGKDTR